MNTNVRLIILADMSAPECALKNRLLLKCEIAQIY